MLATWLLRVFTWDGVLPVCLITIPSILHWALPNNRGIIEITAVALPIVAFFVRATVGHRHIASNNCSSVFRSVQYRVFYLAIFVFVLVDCFLILTQIMPRVPANNDDNLISVAVIGTYFLLMGVAMYPGQSKPLPEVLRF